MKWSLYVLAGAWVLNFSCICVGKSVSEVQGGFEDQLQTVGKWNRQYRPSRHWLSIEFAKDGLDTFTVAPSDQNQDKFFEKQEYVVYNVKTAKPNQLHKDTEYRNEMTIQRSNNHLSMIMGNRDVIAKPHVSKHHQEIATKSSLRGQEIELQAHEPPKAKSKPANRELHNPEVDKSFLSHRKHSKGSELQESGKNLQELEHFNSAHKVVLRQTIESNGRSEDQSQLYDPISNQMEGQFVETQLENPKTLSRVRRFSFLASLGSLFGFGSSPTNTTTPQVNFTIKIEPISTCNGIQPESTTTPSPIFYEDDATVTAMIFRVLIYLSWETVPYLIKPVTFISRLLLGTVYPSLSVAFNSFVIPLKTIAHYNRYGLIAVLSKIRKWVNFSPFFSNFVDFFIYSMKLQETISNSIFC